MKLCDLSKNQKDDYCTSLKKSMMKHEKQLLKIFLVAYLHKFFCGFFNKKFKYDLGENFELLSECYAMDGKIMQTLISEIIESGEYTLEGIATYTKIPLDIIIDVTCGNNNQLSATSWVRIADLYMQVKSSVSKIFFEKLIETLKEYNSKITSLLNET